MKKNGPDAVEIPIDGVLDLHTFRPQDVKDLVSNYLEECRRRRILHVRIIHGKGSGTLKRIVRGVLEKDPAVADYRDAGPGGGDWGATQVTLKPDKL